MILGIGTDLVEIDRVQKLSAKFPGKFSGRIFTARETAYCRRFRERAGRYAARLAAKEAVFKALGTGLARGVKWREVEVVNSPVGLPEVVLSGRTAALAQEKGVRKVHLTLSHGKNAAVAFVLLEG